MTDSSSVSSLVKQWVREEIRAINAYHVPPAENLIKLDAMENPYVWPDSLRREWIEKLASIDVNRYPDPAAHKLRQRLEKTMQMPQGMASMLGNGSDEIIQIICMALSGPGRTVLSFEPGFVMYQMIAMMTGMNYIGVPLDSNFELDMPSLRTAIQEQQPAVIFIAWPNNPTGNLFDEAQVREIITLAPGLVVVDEAYHAFSGTSFMPMLSEYPNLVVMRTVSKMGLAGLRLGFLAGDPAWIAEFDKVRLPYNINVLTQASADIALRHEDILNQQTEQICRDRESLYKELTAIDGLKVYPSAANFILVKSGKFPAVEIFEHLKSEGILIKQFSPGHPQLGSCLRFTVGTPLENEALIAALRKKLA